MVTEKELNAIAGYVGAKYGYLNVTAAFVEHRDLKVAWTRTGLSIDFFVSDYLRGAKKEVLEDIIDVVFRRMLLDEDARYGVETINWMTSDDFVKKNQRKYLARDNGVWDDRLDESYQRLVSKGFLRNDPYAKVRYGELDDDNTLVSGSTLFRTAKVNPKIKGASERELDYAVFRGMIPAELGFSGKPDIEAYNKMEASYPDATKIKADIKKKYGLKDRKSADLDKEVWEGWTVRDFILEQLPVMDMIMSGQAIQKPFKSKAEMQKYLNEERPYYKRTIPEETAFFAERYGLKDCKPKAGMQSSKCLKPKSTSKKPKTLEKSKKKAAVKKSPAENPATRRK